MKDIIKQAHDQTPGNHCSNYSMRTVTEKGRGYLNTRIDVDLQNLCYSFFIFFHEVIVLYNPFVLLFWNTGQFEAGIRWLIPFFIYSLICSLIYLLIFLFIFIVTL